MCYHVSQHKGLETIRDKFKKPVTDLELFEKGYHLNGFAKPYMPVISTDNKEEIGMYRWKLIPHWVKKEADWKANTLNAKGEELFEKNTYKAYWKNRCLVICTGFFEPHHIKGQKQAQSYFIKPREGDFLTLGGIFSWWDNIPTFSIITVAASPLLEEIHNQQKRMPLILDGDEAEAWLLSDLKKEEMSGLMAPYAHDERLEGYRVMDGVTNPRVNTNVEEVLKPV
ncbi:SOS response-associated peptidase [Echinicola jeungdonensis]|uniref:Abasic site processing protein n=1 Tax=Echinicola jeungdonensis TaxID=709343 RepID=A0ABV5J9C9_9BACT|nr:SOS response-associated peptidase [Echinicola jeungdonensis]MDN3670461.1 SOS response-associated peptidase [Echinicola jeungdonensis]